MLATTSDYIYIWWLIRPYWVSIKKTVRKEFTLAGAANTGDHKARDIGGPTGEATAGTVSDNKLEELVVGGTVAVAVHS